MEKSFIYLKQILKNCTILANSADIIAKKFSYSWTITRAIDSSKVVADSVSDMESVELVEADIPKAALEEPLDKHKRDICMARYVDLH